MNGIGALEEEGRRLFLRPLPSRLPPCRLHCCLLRPLPRIILPLSVLGRLQQFPGRGALGPVNLQQGVDQSAQGVIRLLWQFRLFIAVKISTGAVEEQSTQGGLVEGGLAGETLEQQAADTEEGGILGRGREEKSNGTE